VQNILQLPLFIRSSILKVFKKSSSTTLENRNLDIVVAFLYKLWKMDAQGGFIYDVSITFPITNSKLAAIKSIWGCRYVVLRKAAIE
jgi:hypothetical protein